jgi:hypothetical protein
MSEPRWNDAGTREPPRQPPRQAPGARPTSPEYEFGSRRERPERPPTKGTSPRWGNLPWGRGIVLVASAAGLGVLVTVVTGSDPGFLLGLLVVIGTVAACLAVSPRRAFLIIPAPALAYLAAAILAGLIHDRAADTSRTLLAINAARWVASGFLAMVAATAFAVVIAGVRWLRTTHRTGLPQPPGRGSQVPAPPGRSPGDRNTGDPSGRRLPR